LKEIKYEEEYQKSNINHYIPVPLIFGAFFFILIFFDYLLSENNGLQIILIWRSIFLILSISFYLYRRFLLPDKYIYICNTIYEVIALLIFLTIAFNHRPFNYWIEYIELIIFFLVIFFLIPNNLTNKSIITLTASIIFLYLSTTKINVDIEYKISYILAIAIIIICIYASYLIEKLQRQNSLKQKKLEYLSIIDPLTGIYNRRKFYFELEKQINTVKRYCESLSLIMLDVDHFKEINDQYGHLFGDKVLRELSKMIKKEIRIVDTFARIGGEEFVILLPKTPKKDAINLAERLRKRIKSYKIDGQIDLTCSFGVVEYTDGDSDKFMKNLDDLLYKAKQRGRNQVVATL
jgi:diguanylate cyclase (GGDEF)-like protein